LYEVLPELEEGAWSPQAEAGILLPGIFLDQPARRASSLGTIPFITLLAFLACVQLLRQAGHAVSVTATRPRGM